MSSPFVNLPAGSKIMVAYSGGVDSSYAAELCRDAGFQVLTVTMLLYGEDAKSLSSFAEESAKKRGFEHQTLDLSVEFQERVMRHTWDVYSRGLTPNPCAVCNPLFKFGRLADFARANGCAAMVTGHYARISFEEDFPVLSRGLCRAKDQSYFLFGVPKEALAFARMPLGELDKEFVLEKAKALELPASGKKESQDVCFGGDNMPDMLCSLFQGKALEGKFISETGRVLGTHRGIQFYTIGQRKGTGVAMGIPAYVRAIHPENNTIELTTDVNALLTERMHVESVSWLAKEIPFSDFTCEVQTRYRSKPVLCTVHPESEAICTVDFASPHKSVAPGQAAVFYQGDRVLGGGWIRRT